MLFSMGKAYRRYRDNSIPQRLDELFRHFLQRKANDSDVRRFSTKVFGERRCTLGAIVNFVCQMGEDYSFVESWKELLINWKRLIEECIINEEPTTASFLEMHEEDTEEKETLKDLLDLLNGEIEQDLITNSKGKDRAGVASTSLADHDMPVRAEEGDASANPVDNNTPVQAKEKDGDGGASANLVDYDMPVRAEEDWIAGVSAILVDHEMVVRAKEKSEQGKKDRGRWWRLGSWIFTNRKHTERSASV